MFAEVSAVVPAVAVLWNCYFEERSTNRCETPQAIEVLDCY